MTCKHCGAPDNPEPIAFTIDRETGARTDYYAPECAYIDMIPFIDERGNPMCVRPYSPNTDMAGAKPSSA